MSTICFDLKRINKHQVAIKHIDLNAFQYNTHLPLSSWVDWVYDGKDNRLLCVFIAKWNGRPNRGEEIIGATLDIKTGINEFLISYQKDADFEYVRPLIIPFSKFVKGKGLVILDLGNNYILENKSWTDRNKQKIKKTTKFR